MVIPLGGGDDGGMMAPMAGPPPPALVRRFKQIKYCLVIQIVGLACQLGSGIPLQPSNTSAIIINSLNALLIIIIGIFLLKDDPMFAGTHRCLVNTFCAGCADQCQGGMLCLCSWFFICLISAILALLPTSGSQMQTIIAGVKIFMDPSIASSVKWGFPVTSLTWQILMVSFLASEVIVIIGQLFGGVYGFKAFQEMQAIQQGLAGDMAGTGGGMDGGWGAGAPGGGAGGGWGQGAGGAGGAGGAAAGGRSGGPGAGGGGGAGPVGQGPARAQNFHAFQGTGNRLGS